MAEKSARPALRGDLAGLGATAVLSTMIAALVLEVWNADGAPFDYEGDAPFYAMVVKGILEHGWHLENPSLGAPEMQQLYDFPIVSSDNAQAFVVKLLGLVSSDWTWVANTYYLLTFPLTAAAAYVVLRLLSVAVAPAVVCSTLFALLPYHFARGQAELFLSGYVAVPFGCYLVLSILSGRALFARRDEGRARLTAYATGRTLGTVASCLLIALAGGSFYYAAFTLLLVAASAVAAALVRRRVDALVTGAVVVALIVTAVVANAAPSLAYRADHGSNELVGDRGRGESEIFALKLTQLVLPIEDHRVAALGRASTRYAETTPFGELGEPVHLGFIPTLGFLGLLLVVVVRVLAPDGVALRAAYRHAAVATLFALLLGTVGGVSALIAAAMPQLRAWNRLSIFIGFFALLAVGLAMTGLRGRLAPWGRGKIAYAGILAAILVVGVLDQTSADEAPAYDNLRTEITSDEGFVRAIEARLPAGSAVLQLPYVPFPEAGLAGGTGDYDHVRLYLHSDSIRWSFGAMKGRPQDWLAQRRDEPIDGLVSAARAAGFDGLSVDRHAYTDRGLQIEDGLSRFLDGERPLVSANGRLAFYDLRPRATQDGSG